MDTVKLQLQKEYELPSICCACGGPAGRARYSVGGSSWTSRRMLHLLFPLCDRCEQAYSAATRGRRAGCVSSAFLAIVLALTGWLISLVSGEGSLAESIGGWLLILAALSFVAGVAAYFLLPLRVPRETRDIFRQVTRSVTIKNYVGRGVWGQGTVTIRFAHDQFAALFKQVNSRYILESHKD